MLKKLKGNIFTYGLILMVLAIGVAVGTYAYYQNTVSGNVSGTVLAWDCALGSSGVQKNTFANLYPGSSGSITFNVTSTITSTFEIKITGFSNMNSGTRAALKLYKDSAHSSVISANTVIATGTVSSNGGNGSATIYYYWPYGSEETYTDAVPSFTWEITCKQT